jgi:Tfp pilus assembly protein FimT
MRNSGYSLFELTIILLITSILALQGWHTVSLWSYKIAAMLSLRQIRMAIEYGRSAAIANGAGVTICPATESSTCGSEWKQGLQLLSSKGKLLKKFPIYGVNIELNLVQSGFTRQKLVLETNGMIHNNGHFNYKTDKVCDFPQFNLYFNKALRIYIDDG